MAKKQLLVPPSVIQRPQLDPTAVLRRAGALVRISDDKADDREGVARQESDCDEAAGRKSWGISTVYVENDTSAYKRRKVVLPDGTTGLRVIRPAFRQMLQDLADGTINALIAYNLDRVARDPRDLEDLIDVVEEHKIPTYAVTGLLDLSSDAGITNARIMCAIGNQSSRDQSRRAKRKQLALAQAGKHKGGGRRPFGFERDGVTIRESEAKAVRDMCERLLRGEGVTGVARWLDETGVKPCESEKWNAASIREMLKAPRIAGKRSYQGEIMADAVWPAIIPFETWEQVNALFASRANGQPNQLRWWLTGVLICGKCGHGLTTGGTQAQGGRYWCSTPRGGCGGIATNLPKTELAVETMLKAWLSRPDVLSLLQDQRGSTAVEEAKAAVKADQAQLNELASMYGQKEITREEYRAARQPIAERLESAQDLVRASLPSVMRTLTSGDVGEAWDRFTPAEKREVARVVWPNGIKVMPSVSNRFQGWDASRLVPVDWVEGVPPAQ
jgi:site-specific DNA recombinase